MEERTMRKIHPVLQVLIMAAVILGLRLLFSWLIQPYMLQMVREALFLYQLLNFAVSVLAPFLAGLLCFKAIENRPVHWGVLLLISLVYQLLVWLPSTLVNSYIGRFGVDALAGYARINVITAPLLSATAMTIVVRLLCAPRNVGSAGDPSAKISLVAHVLLLLFTCGIWHIIWIYRTTRYLNCVPGEEYRNPGTKLLLCMLVPFYSIYWVYKTAQRIDKLAATVDVVSDLTVVCLILEIFVPLIPPILMQDKINKIVEANTITF